MGIPEVDPAKVRDFLIHRLLPEPSPRPDVSGVVDQLGFVQEDSIDVCGRMHDLILRNRCDVGSAADTHGAIYGPESGLFEVHFSNLSLVRIKHLRHFASVFQARRASHPLEAEYIPEADRLLAHIRDYGAIRVRDLPERRGSTLSGWGSRRSIAAHAAERLWYHGRLTISGRSGFERWFDLPERRYGAEARWLEDGCSLPDEAESIRVKRRLHRRSRPIAAANRRSPPWITFEDPLRFRVQGHSMVWAIESADFDALATAPPSPPRTALLAPLDPLIYDRDLVEAAFGVRYRWEVYVPGPKRKLGYYVLPILQDGRICGWVDLSRSGDGTRLSVNAGALEPFANRDRIEGELASLARFNGASEHCSRCLTLSGERGAFAAASSN